jgi:UrcA family protein
MLVHCTRFSLFLTGIARIWGTHMKCVATALISALPIFALPANCPAAAPADNVRTQIVTFADLDTTRAAGAHALYHRIQRAARDVCEVDDARAYPSESYQHCTSAAIARAVAEVGSPLLTQYHLAATHALILQPGLAQLNR